MEALLQNAKGIQGTGDFYVQAAMGWGTHIA